LFIDEENPDLIQHSIFFNVTVFFKLKWKTINLRPLTFNKIMFT